MSSRVLKSNEVLLGIPLKIRAAAGFFDDEVPDKGIAPADFDNNGSGNGNDSGNGNGNGSGNGSGIGAVAQKAGDEGGNGAADKKTPDEIYAYIIDEANREAVRIMDEAKIIAERIVEEAREKAAEIEEEANGQGYAKGYEEGYEEGETKAKSEYQQLLDEAGQIREKAVEEYNNILESSREDIVNLVIKAAERVVASELCTSQEIVLNVVKEAIEKCSNRDGLILRVSKDDLEFVKENEVLIRGAVEGIGQLEIKEDLSLGKGSCVVESHFGYIDSSIKTRMQKLKAAFGEALKRQV